MEKAFPYDLAELTPQAFEEFMLFIQKQFPQVYPWIQKKEIYFEAPFWLGPLLVFFAENGLDHTIDLLNFDEDQMVIATKEVFQEFEKVIKHFS